jgi:hypothetical protein
VRLRDEEDPECGKENHQDAACRGDREVKDEGIGQAGEFGKRNHGCELREQAVGPSRSNEICRRKRHSSRMELAILEKVRRDMRGRRL